MRTQLSIRPCAEYKQYATKDDADRIALKRQKRKKRQTESIQCMHCGGWHVRYKEGT